MAVTLPADAEPLMPIDQPGRVSLLLFLVCKGIPLSADVQRTPQTPAKAHNVNEPGKPQTGPLDVCNSPPND